MSMKARTITVEDKTYQILFSSNALFRLQKATGMTIQQLGVLLVMGNAGFAELQSILWAGLEGARLRNKTRRSEWTIDEVGDLIDEAGGVLAVWGEDSPFLKIILEAWEAAFPAPREEEQGDKKPSDPPPAVSTGTDSAMPPSESD